jgi:putative transferase (TIGR04331 family)
MIKKKRKIPKTLITTVPFADKNRLPLELLVRTYHGDYNWDQRNRWKDVFPNFMFDDNQKMDKSIRQSKLMIPTYSETTYNQTLASNIPTIIYWDETY